MAEPTAKDLGIKFTIEGRPLSEEGEEGVTEDTGEDVTDDRLTVMAGPAIDWYIDELARLRFEVRCLAISHIILCVALSGLCVGVLLWVR